MMSHSPNSRVLLFGQNSLERDAYANVLSGNGLHIEVAEESDDAHYLLQNRQITSIVVLASANQAAGRELLRIRNQHFHSVPVYFATPPTLEAAQTPGAESSLAVAPADAQTTPVATLAAPHEDAVSAPRPAQRVGLPTIWISQTEYPILFRDAREQFEAQFLRKVLRRYHGNVSRVSRAIDMARRNVQMKIKHHGIELAEYRDFPDDF